MIFNSSATSDTVRAVVLCSRESARSIKSPPAYRARARAPAEAGEKNSLIISWYAPYARHVRRRTFRYVKITGIVTQPRQENSYRRFIGRYAGNSGGGGQGRQMVRCMRNLQTPLWTRLSAMWLILNAGT